MTTGAPSPTSRDVNDLGSPVLVIALGSWEQHGPHLPLDTDTRIAEELAHRLVQHMTSAVRGPSIGVSSSGEHAGFAGTLSVGGQVLVDTIVELCRSADWARAMVVVNGHGGNNGYLDRARDLLCREGRPILIWSPPSVDPRDSHAGWVETSVMLALDPSAVRTAEIAPGPTPHLDDILDALRHRGVASVSPSGVLGDPQRADPELGRRILATWENDLIHSVTTWIDTVDRHRDPTP